MRILQLGRFYPPDLGGVESVMFEVTEGLNERGIPCDVLCSNSNNALEISHFGRYRVIRTPSLGTLLSTSISPTQISHLKKVVRDYDIIHVHHPDPMATVALLLCNTSQKIVVHWHSDIIRQKFAFLFYRPLQNSLLRRASKVIVTSPNYLKTSSHLEQYKDKTEVVPIGIDANFKINDQKLGELRAAFAGRKMIFTLGRHVYYKGLQHLIHSAHHLNDGFVIVIGGLGPLTNSLKQMVEENNLTPRIVFTGAIPSDEIGSYFEVCDVFCLPSIERTEAFGVVLLEAMSFGKPLVATNIPGSGMNWVNQDNETGLNVQPENPKALADAFIKIASDSQLARNFARNSKKRYEHCFTREKMIDKLITIYSNL